VTPRGRGTPPPRRGVGFIQTYKLYVGIARDPDARFAVHCSGRGAFYTRLNRPVRILTREWYPTQSAALKAEYSLKQRKTDEKWVRTLAGGGARLKLVNVE